MKNKIKWFKKVDKNDYPAAYSYLNLIYSDKTCTELIDKLKTSEICNFKSKDIFRASGLSLLGINNTQVQKNLNKIKKGKKLFPILLVRDSTNGKVIIADGYHRISSIYRIDENAIIHCIIIDL